MTWLSLDEADADPSRMLAYLVLAVEAAGVDAARQEAGLADFLECVLATCRSRSGRAHSPTTRR